MNQTPPLIQPNQVNVTAQRMPGPLVQPHQLEAASPGQILSLSVGGETKLEKLAGQLVAVQLQQQISPMEVQPLTDDEVAMITENAVRLAGATLELAHHVQHGGAADASTDPGTSDPNNSPPEAKRPILEAD